MTNVRGGIITVMADGDRVDVKGPWTYNLGRPMKEAIVGADGVHGYKTVPQVSFCEGPITDRRGLNLATDLLDKDDATIVLQLANGKSVVFRNAWFAGPGSVSTEEGEIAARFESLDAEEVS